MDKDEFFNKQPLMTLDELFADEIFGNYYRFLVMYNERFNLTSLTAKEDVYLKHFYDSILPADLLPNAASVLDIGSGAGFPGICLKLVRPDLFVTMLDSVNKKVGFLQDMIFALALANTRAVHCRIEDFDGIDIFGGANFIDDGLGENNAKSANNCAISSNHVNDDNCVNDSTCAISDKISKNNTSNLTKKHTTKGFDVVTSRAVAATNILAEYSLPFVKKGGFALFYKSGTAALEDELNEAKPAIKKLGGAIEEVYKRNLTDEITRSFVVVRKVADTPAGYPRKGNKPRLNPLK